MTLEKSASKKCWCGFFRSTSRPNSEGFLFRFSPPLFSFFPRFFTSQSSFVGIIIITSSSIFNFFFTDLKMGRCNAIALRKNRPSRLGGSSPETLSVGTGMELNSSGVKTSQRLHSTFLCLQPWTSLRHSRLSLCPFVPLSLGHLVIWSLGGIVVGRWTLWSEGIDLQYLILIILLSLLSKRTSPDWFQIITRTFVFLTVFLSELLREGDARREKVM